MTVYKKILIALDLSKNSKEILKKFKELSNQFNAKSFIVHVIEPMPISSIGFEVIDMVSLEMELIKASKKQLAKIGSKYNIDTENQFVEVGQTKHEILRIAEEQKIDLIIVGSHGRHGLDYLLGSTANAIAQSAKCDVLLVRA